MRRITSFFAWIALLIQACQPVAYSPSVVTPAMPTVTPEMTPPTASPQQPISRSARLAWFSKPPNDSLRLLAENFDFVILTHKDEHARDELRTLGKKEPILAYLTLIEIRDPGSCTEVPYGNQVANRPGDFCRINAEHPDWFLLDHFGQRISKDGVYLMDPGNPAYRAFWLERARQLIEGYGWDGIFIDNVDSNLKRLLTQYLAVPTAYDEAGYQQAIEGFLAYVYEAYFRPLNHPVIANILDPTDQIWSRYLQHLDGALLEDFAVDWHDGYRSPADWENQLTLLEQAISQNKTLLLVAQGDRTNLPRQTFALASYLLIASEHTYFRYTNADHYEEIWLYPNYSFSLGAPLGGRYREGNLWRRDFNNGYVLVDPSQHSAIIHVATERSKE